MRNRLVPAAARKSSRGGDFIYNLGGGSEAKLAADVAAAYVASGDLEADIAAARAKMEAAARELDFAEATRWRDIMYGLQEKLPKS
jgi:excinuclease ABC subunit B